MKQISINTIDYYIRETIIGTVLKNVSEYGNTDITKNQISEVFTHVFDTEYKLSDGIGLFKPDENMAHSFQRLIDMPQSIEEKDLILLKHEYVERQFMKKEFRINKLMKKQIRLQIMKN